VSRRGLIEGIVWVLTGIFVVMMFMEPVSQLLRQLAREVDGFPP
jgi:hypothetical protein